MAAGETQKQINPENGDISWYSFSVAVVGNGW